MFNKFSYLILFLVICSAATGQSRFPLKANASWTVALKQWNYQCELEQGDDIYNYFFDGDTLISSKKYFKLYKSGIAFYDSPFKYENVYVGALRDSLNRYYFCEKNKSDEIMIYNFDIQEGDSTFTGINQQKSFVYSIDTLNDGRKEFTCFSEFTWGGKCSSGRIIEGIGGIGGLLEYMPCNHPGLRENYLICYSENNSKVFESNLNNCFCDISGYTSVSKFQVEDIKVYPVPANDFLTIEFPENEGELIIEIVNLLGEKLIYKQIQNSEGKLKINVTTLNKDIYFLKIHGNDFSLSKKILIE